MIKKKKEKKNRVVISGVAMYVFMVFVILGAMSFGYATVYFIRGGSLAGLELVGFIIQYREAYVENVNIREEFAPHILNCEGNQMCVIDVLSKNLMNRTGYLGQFEGKLSSPERVLRVNGGDCEDLSVLMVSVLRQFGIKAYVDCSISARHCVAFAFPKGKQFHYVIDLANDDIQIIGNGSNFWDFYGN